MREASIADPAPEPSGGSAVNSDTERVKLALAAGAIIGTWVWDLVEDRVSVDEQFAEAFGLDPALGRDGLSRDQVIATVHPDDLPALMDAMDTAIARGGPYSHQYRVRRRDGRYYWIEANGRIDLADDGTPLRFPGVLIDVDERRHIQLERDEALRLLRLFTQAVPGVVYAKDRSGRMLVANAGTTELIGKPPEQYLGRTDLEILDDRVQAALVMETDRRIMESGASGMADRFLLKGPLLLLPSETVQPLTMILHELTTNALKYGALSEPGGRVEVTWEALGQGWSLVWTETGGRPYSQPVRQGFGSRLISRLAAQLRGAADFDWRPEGLSFRVRA